eukprot:Ihof_evm2s461 gene=Ihof_evmTU2s461
MRWLSLLTALSIGLVAMTQGRGTKSTQAKIEELNQKTAVNPVIDMSMSDYKRYAQGAKNYTLIFMLTSLTPAFPCPACFNTYKIFELVARSFSLSSHTGVYFAKLEYSPSTLALYEELHIAQIPTIMHLSPDRQPGPQDIVQAFDRPELGAAWVAEMTNKKFRIQYPINWTKWIIAATVTILMIKRIKRAPMSFYPKALKVILLFLAMGLSMLMTGGFMYSMIAHSPMHGEDENGHPIIFLVHEDGNQSKVEGLAISSM